MKDQHHKDPKKITEERLQELRAQDHLMPADSRARCREGFDMTITDLVAIGKGEVDNTSASARIRAIDYLGKYGYGKATVYIQNEEFLRVVGQITSRYIADRETFARWIADIKHALEQQ